MIEEIPLKFGTPERGTKIVKAAVMWNDKVYTGWRHIHIMLHLRSLGKEHVTQDEQGFVDAEGHFQTRYRSSRFAYHAGQVRRIKHMLTSEDVWDEDGVPHINDPIPRSRTLP